LVPALGWVVCKYILSIPLELMTLLTLYGYSLVTFLPSAVRPAASHRIASHRIASHRIASHRIASPAPCRRFPLLAPAGTLLACALLPARPP
jgi:hypothetical protein